ncbi:MAG TPA: NAD-dependent epimerase/dehydratase family protein [Nocardioidaceae bacterium]|nr:NAD-dependent epimerase/dehydratase family protein [Nocardioidaceae bacterium]
MDDADKVHVVVGASGGTGRALVHELVRRGRRVRAINRSGHVNVPAGVEVIAADAADAARMQEACKDAGVVYNAVNPPFHRWREDFPAVVDGVLAGARSADARMVFVDDTWMYGRVDGPMTEDMPYRPVSDKGVLRAWLAERVLAAHARGQVRTVIGRATELYGPGVESLLAGNIFKPALRGRRALWIGALDQALGPTYIADFAFGLAELGEREAAVGSAWHVPTPQPVTAGRFIQLVFAHAEHPVKVTRLSQSSVRALGVFWPVAREGAEMLYQFRQPHSVDASRYRTIAQERITPYDEGISVTLSWYRHESDNSFAAIGR